MVYFLLRMRYWIHPSYFAQCYTDTGIISTTLFEACLYIKLPLSYECFCNSARLNNLVEQQPRNRKSRRCMLHSLEIQRTRPPSNAWKEVWECMDQPCRDELALIETDVLDETLDTYLRKHRYNYILRASCGT